MTRSFGTPARSLAAGLVLATGLALSSAAETSSGDPVRGGEIPGQELFGVERLDRILAVVDEDPIFLSDLERATSLAPRSFGATGATEISRRELLDRLIDERLRSHEVDRYGTARLSENEVALQVTKILEAREQAGLAARDSTELDRQEIEKLVRRQQRVLSYVEQRLGALVYVAEDTVRAYYDGTLREEMARQGAPLPPFSEVEPGIRALLREEALNRRIARWTEELRQRAHLVDLLDSPLPLDRLPPVRLRLAPPSSTAPTAAAPSATLSAISSAISSGASASTAAASTAAASTASEEGPWRPTR